MLSTLLSLLSPMQRYRRILSFSITTGSVHALAISIDGAILAAGGTHGIQLWNIETRKEISIMTHLESCGIISSAIWIKTKYALGETLCYGTALGYVVFVRSSPVEKQKYYQEICAQRLGAGLKVTCFAWDPSSSESSHIAVGTRDHAVQVLSLSSSSQLQSVFAGRLDNTVPKALCFADHSLYIFGLYDGKVIKLSIKDGTIMSENRCRSVIGSAAVYLKKGVFVIDNATDGFMLYHLNGADPIRTFVTDPLRIPVPKQVAFGEGSKVMIGGGSNRSVFVFDRRTGRPLATLQHTRGALVQTIGVRDIGGRCTIACASPAVGQKRAVVSVWAHQYDSQKAQPADTECRRPAGSFFTYFAHIVIGLLCILVGSRLHTIVCIVVIIKYANTNYLLGRVGGAGHEL
ncbi:WD40-repeat-containing domain protein [Pisolithus thermaeus]|nr:WD40-repeat-containing domain protein [Pisolithus thermaeus]